jgi:hypothetical protein
MGEKEGRARRADWEGEYAMSPKMERNWKEKRGAEMPRKPRKKVLAEWGRRKGEVVSPVSPERKAGRMGFPLVTSRWWSDTSSKVPSKSNNKQQ